MSKRSRSRIFRGVFIIILLIVIVLFITAPRNISLTQNYETETVTKGEVSLTVSASGEVVPVERSSVLVTSQYKVVEINVKVGDKVTSGQQLAKLDDYALQNSLKKAQYNYNSAIYNRNQAQEATIKDDNKINQLQQQVNSAYVDLQTAERALNNDQYIKSPIDGVVSASNLYIGNTPSQTTPAFIIEKADAFKVNLKVNQSDISKVTLDQEVTFEFSALEGTRKGVVSKIFPASIVETSDVVNYYVETTIEDITNLKADMTVDAEMLISRKSDVLTVPSAALIFDSGRSYVYKISTQQATSPTPPQLERVEVTVGLNNNTTAEILTGLNEGDTIAIYTSADSVTASPTLPNGQNANPLRPF
jgi:membrane fusion protein, macrolide-specific efflux system